MPRLVSRDEAVASLPRGRCVVCALQEGLLGAPLWLHREDAVVALLPRMAARWGHALVSVRAHVTCFTDLPEATWVRMAVMARRIAVAVERELAPARVYVASLGTSRDDLPMTCPHLHLHVIPVQDENTRPRDVLTWSHGVWVGEEPEWVALQRRLAARLR